MPTNMVGAVRRVRQVDPNGNVYYDKGVSDIIFDPVRGVSVKQDIDELRGQMLTAMAFVAANPKGMDGKSAYEIAVEHGYKGTEDEWIVNARGEAGEDGLSAYEIACVYGGFTGTIEEWLASLKGEPGSNGLSAYQSAVNTGYEGTEEEWCRSLNTTPITDDEIIAIYNKVVKESESEDVDYNSITKNINLINDKIDTINQSMQDMVVNITIDTDAGTLTFTRHNGDDVTRTIYTAITEEDIDTIIEDYYSNNASVQNASDMTYKWVNGEAIPVD